MKNFLIILAIIVVVVGGGSLLKKNSKSDVAANNAKPTSHIKGSSTTGVKLVEFGDFECPGCGGFHPIIKQVLDHYGDQISFQFVHFPLTTIHQSALAAARAAEAASNQGKFWEMYDKLYENQSAWKNVASASSVFEGYANELKLDMTKYRTDFASAETNATINADIKTGQDKKVTSTPSFFVDGELIAENNDAASAEKFIAYIDAKIAAKTGTAPASSSTTPTDTTSTGTEPAASN